jgi:hypothetical protein
VNISGVDHLSYQRILVIDYSSITILARQTYSGIPIGGVFDVKFDLSAYGGRRVYWSFSNAIYAVPPSRGFLRINSVSAIATPIRAT